MLERHEIRPIRIGLINVTHLTEGLIYWLLIGRHDQFRTCLTTHWYEDAHQLSPKSDQTDQLERHKEKFIRQLNDTYTFSNGKNK